MHEKLIRKHQQKSKMFKRSAQKLGIKVCNNYLVLAHPNHSQSYSTLAKKFDIANYKPCARFTFVENLQSKVLGDDLAKDSDGKPIYMQPVITTTKFTNELFTQRLTNARRAWDTVPFSFDRSDIVYPNYKLDQVNDWLESTSSGNHEKTNLHEFLTLNGRSGDGKTFVSRFIASKYDIFVVFLNFQILKLALHAIADPNTRKPTTVDLVVLAHLVVLDRLIDQEGTTVSPIVFLNMLQFGSTLVYDAYTEITEQAEPFAGLTDTIERTIQSIYIKTGKKVLFFVDEAHRYAAFFPGKVETHDNQAPGSGLTIISRALQLYARSIYASTKISSVNFEHEVSHSDLRTRCTLNINGNALKPAEKYVNKFINIVDHNDAVYYNLLFRHAPIRANA